MYSTGKKEIINDSMYAQKMEETFPSVTISARSVQSLLPKKYNESFPMNIDVRVISIEEQEVGNGNKETFYKLEVRAADIAEKTVDEMSPDEIKRSIEEDQ